jgi:hypothetical protein
MDLQDSTMTDHQGRDTDAFDTPPALDPDLVAEVVGKHVLVGLTFVKYNGDVIEQKQLHGIVERITRDEGIVIRQADGSIYRLPPDLSGIEEAPPGVYRLRSTGEEVENPDFFYTWTITRPDA